MGRVNTPILDIEAKNALEQGFKTGKIHAFRVRCQLVLLKSENRKSKEVASIVKMCEMSVNNWLVRYSDEGIEGLKTKKGRGRKPLLNKSTDEVSIWLLLLSSSLVTILGSGSGRTFFKFPNCAKPQTVRWWQLKKT